MLGLKQPFLGIVATFLVMAVSLVLISLFDFPTFSGWISYLLMCLIPMQIVVGVVWGTNHPAFAARQSQPAKGVLLLLTTLLVGAVVVPVSLATAGGNVTPPSPMLMHLIIVSVVVTFWAAIIFGGWPFTAAIGNPVAAGLTMLAAAYVVNYLLFQVFFNYAFMQGAPVYVASLDPQGMFHALNVLVFFVTCLVGLFTMASFDLWPLTQAPGLMQQPILGIVWTIIAAIISGLIYWIGISLMGLDVMDFLVTVPVPFIFGTIVVQNMFQNSLFGKLQQPARGIANVIAVIAIGSVLAQIYRALGPIVTGPLAAGPPTYDLEVWIASALLSVTFPFLIFFSEFFNFWPLGKTHSAPLARD